MSTRLLAKLSGRTPTKLSRQMRKTLTEIRSLARSHTKTALNVLVGIMRSKDATAAARVSAANAILDAAGARPPSRSGTMTGLLS